MDLTQISPNATPLAVDGLPTLYGKHGYWEVALPMPRTATLWASPPALPQRGRGQARFAEPGEVAVVLENGDGTGDMPDAVMLDAARWLVANDAVVERAIIDTILADLPVLRELERQVTPGDAAPLPEGWDEAQMRSRVRLLHIALHSVRGASPYFGVELACDWEVEHGYGILFHGTEVVETGGGDVPNLSWIAARHAEGRQP